MTPLSFSPLGRHCSDLKLENLLLDKRENLKVSDFGFSKMVSPQSQPPPTPSYRMMSCFSHLSQTYCGSFAYACPEILLGLPYNPFLSDTWSMGVILYTLVVAHLPFDDTNLKKLLRETQKEVNFPSHLQISDEIKVRRTTAGGLQEAGDLSLVPPQASECLIGHEKRNANPKIWELWFYGWRGRSETRQGLRRASGPNRSCALVGFGGRGVRKSPNSEPR